MGKDMRQDLQEVLFTKEQIDRRVAEMGAQISSDYADAVGRGEELVLVGLLRGSVIFMADLARAIQLPLRMDFMCVSSYGDAAKSSGRVRIEKDLSEDITGKHVIVVEDIIDSGLTLASLRDNFVSRGPLSVEVASFLRKDVPGQADVFAKYLGFECPNEFVVGYGLDYAQHYRNLPDVCILRPEVYA